MDVDDDSDITHAASEATISDSEVEVLAPNPTPDAASANKQGKIPAVSFVFNTLYMYNDLFYHK